MNKNRKLLTLEQKKANKKIYNKKYYAYIKKPLTAAQKERKRINAKKYYEKPENKTRILAQAKEKYWQRKLEYLTGEQSIKVV